MYAVAQPPARTELVLEHERQRVAVTEVGAALRSWTVRGHELLDTTDASDFRGKVLLPWPNRLRDGRYIFEGAEHRTALTEPERGNALHGLATGRRWRAIRSSTRHLTLAYELGPEPGCPFSLRLAVDYELTSGGVVSTLHATNTGTTAAPFGAGLHPYLSHATARIDELVLEVPARMSLEERLLPSAAAVRVQGTASTSGAGGASAPRAWTPASATSAAARRGRPRQARRQRGRAAVHDLDGPELFASSRSTRLTMCPPGPSPRGVAIGPMTCAPIAFNSGDGLLVLEPGASFTGRCGLTATGFSS